MSFTSSYVHSPCFLWSLHLDVFIVQWWFILCSAQNVCQHISFRLAVVFGGYIDKWHHFHTVTAIDWHSQRWIPMSVAILNVNNEKVNHFAVIEQRAYIAHVQKHSKHQLQNDKHLIVHICTICLSQITFCFICHHERQRQRQHTPFCWLQLKCVSVSWYIWLSLVRFDYCTTYIFGALLWWCNSCCLVLT